MVQLKDVRSLSPAGQEALRQRAVQAVLGGMKQTTVARTFGVARGTLARWLRQYRQGGEAALDQRPQGRPPVPKLLGEQETTIVALLAGHCPDQLGWPGSLWTRETVGTLIRRHFGLALSVWTLGRYLRRWGLTLQQPARRAYQQDPKGDEMGVRSDHQAGRTWGRQGRTPVVWGTGQRFRSNIISTLTNQGVLRFRVFQENFNGEGFIDFLRRLVWDRGRKVYLIVERHPVHISRKARRWVEHHQTYLPPYSPELNPGEFLNQDVKANAAGRQRPRTKVQMMANLRTYLLSTQKFPDLARRYFHAEAVRYAAI